MPFGKKFKHRILEKLRLPFIMDFLKLHSDGAFVATNLGFAGEGAATGGVVIVKWRYSAVDGKKFNGRMA
jgi:hypothetical protein